MSAPSKELLDEIYRRKILQARSMTPEERVATGMQLSNLAMRVMKEGVRDQFPAADEAEVRRILRQRLTRLRQVRAQR